MKSILVTGGCGFIGANFIRYLFETAGFSGTVVNVDKLTYAGNPESLADIAETYTDRYRLETVDIIDQAEMMRIIREYRVDTVCHFAAESHVDRSIAGPAAFVTANVVGTFSLLEAARAQGDQIRRFHHVSTDEVYGSLGPTGFFTETTPYQPNSPYSASKASSDHFVRAYGHTYGLPYTISNCSNNYGPYQFPEKLIPLMLLNAMEGKPLPVYGDGKNVRDWLYVTDHCHAIYRILQAGRAGEVYNIGGNCEIPNLQVVETICDALDRRLGRSGGAPRRDLIRFVKDRPGHDQRYAIDASKIENELGWTPSESFSSGIEKTLDWYIAHPEWVDRVRSGEYRRWIETQYE